MLARDRFEDKKLYRQFIKKVKVDMNSLCWFWDGALSDTGYGKFRHNYKTISAHRMAYIIFIGDIPSGKYICHKCDVKKCVNPAHLFCGTHADNMADMHRKGRWKSGNYWQHLKLNQQMADIIYNDSRPQQQIADYWEVSRSTISAIKNLRVWTKR